ncbi:hypothetical protein QBC42DRAFT_344604 [Cladorrhinum samala]|uniref:Fucose-specific lectin n=1 Tax=Cladorrhinum samala TaxID=585594 RepID=A0AAV9HW38_9PEZI|nr:hypothetical protein QBC42DRAFT_344604 [Cladorrhinum samala]
MVPARHTDVGRADAFRELDTHKVVYCFGHSNKEVVPENSLPEIAWHDAPELLYPAAGFSIDDKFNTTPAPKNYERPRSRFRFWSNWSARRRWWAAGLGAASAILIVGLAVGLVFGTKNNSSRGAGPDDSSDKSGQRPSTSPSGSSNSNSNSNSSTTTTAGPASMCNGDPHNQVRRGVLTAEFIDSRLFIFARHKSNKGIYYLSLPSSYFSSSPSPANTPSWTRLLPSGKVFLAPPSSTTWLYNGTIRLSIFAVSSNSSNVLSASYLPSQGGWDSEWTSLGGTALSTVSLCKFPAGFSELHLPDDQERVDPWTIEPFSSGGPEQTRVISHSRYDTAKDDFYGRWDRVNTIADAGDSSYYSSSSSSSSSSSAPEARPFTPTSGPAVICGRGNPVSSVLVYSNETSTLKLRHRTAAPSPSGEHDWRWTDWFDLGGPPLLRNSTSSRESGEGARGGFVGDPVMPLYNPEAEQNREWHFLGTGADGHVYALKWNNGSQALSPGYKPEMVDLGNGGGGEEGFGSLPGVVVVVPPSRKRQMHIVVARKADGGLMHKYYQDGSGWDGEWEDLGVKAKSAPYVTGWINERGQTFTGVAFVDGEDGLVFASWETADELRWKGLAVWKRFGGEPLSVESVCL